MEARVREDVDLNWSSYFGFLDRYYDTDEFEGLRLGQAFWNEFMEGSDPETFYETNEQVAIHRIIERYIFKADD